MEARIATSVQPRTLSISAPTGLFGDERLARLTGEGNERAFSTLYTRFHQSLYRYCYSMLRHEADAQDALQSTFTSALVALRRGQRDAPLRPWLFRIAHNESISLLRKRRPVSELSEAIESPMPSVDVAADRRERLALLVADLQELPERQRGALVMRELNGLSHEELAQALGISVGAAKQTVFEGRRALAEFERGRAMACDQIQQVISDGDRRALRARRVRAHLRECSGCTAFAAAIPERRSALLALAPALPAAAASGLFTRITGASSAHHGGGSLLAGTAGKSVGAALSTKTLVTGAAIVATAAAGTAGIVHVVASGHSSHPTAAYSHASASGSSASTAGQATSGSGASRNSAGTQSAGSRQPRNGSSQLRGTAPSTVPGGTGTPSARGAGPGSPSATSPSAPSAPGQSGFGHGASRSNPSTSNPNAHGGNPNARGNRSGSGSSSANAHGGNPNAAGGSSTSHGTNPNARGGNPKAAGGSSTSHGTNPNARGGNPNASTKVTAHGGNPNAITKTNAHGGNPNAGGAKKHG
jgi:RNA polymerase sigma factor (sigma-70 family)